MRSGAPALAQGVGARSVPARGNIAASARRWPSRRALGLWCAALGCATWNAQAVPSFAPIPRFDDVKAAHRPSDVTVQDRHGQAIQTLRVDRSVRRLAWVTLDDMSPALLQAIVLSEDRRFHEHSGVDWSAVARSAWANVWNTRTRGASTLTMQLAGLVEDGLARPAHGRSVAQKIGQAVMATRLDAQWRKSEILEAYLNSVAFRGEVVGINALSQTTFGKHPSGLDTHEAALAAALLRGPNAKAETVAARACGVLRLQGLTCTGVTGLVETALARPGGMPLGEQLAPHFARQALGAAPGRPSTTTTTTNASAGFRSTLDAALQRVAIAALRTQLSELTGRNVEDGAVVVLDNARGEVLAWVGSSGSLSEAAQVDGVLARRQPGSTLKPFVYGLAFEKRLITPASLLDDSPAQIGTDNGLYLPQNYDRDFKGWVSARAALGASLNVPAVRVAALLGPDALHARLNRLGLALPEPAGHYGHALALGGAEVSLLALTNAYRALANGGRLSPVVLTAAPAADGTTVGGKLRGPDARGGDARQNHGARPPRAANTGVAAGAPLGDEWVADPAAVFLVAGILADNNARVLTFGLDSALATRGFAAVKTGTSKDLRDNWCIGFTDRYTVGVWVGNASGEAMHGVSGVSGAAPIWQTLVRHLHRESPSLPPMAPPGVVQSTVHFAAHGEPPRDEFFIAGTQPSVAAASAHGGGRGGATRAFGITSPRDGSTFALDPDMPPHAQRIRFEGEPGLWMLDGRSVGAGPAVDWSPWPGRHTLKLLGHDGQPLQTVRFEVRGAGVRSAQRGR